MAPQILTENTEGDTKQWKDAWFADQKNLRLLKYPQYPRQTADSM